MASTTYPLFVSNVSYSAKRQALCRFFAQYGEGRDPTICKMLMNGKRKFVGSVKLRMPSQCATDVILGLAAAGQLIYQGRTLRVQRWNISGFQPSTSEDLTEQSVECRVVEDWDKENEEYMKEKFRLAMDKGLCYSCADQQGLLYEYDGSVRGVGMIRDPNQVCVVCQHSVNFEEAFRRIPDEVLLTIFDYLPIRDLLSVEQVNDRCQAVASKKFRALKHFIIWDFNYGFLNPISDQDFEKLLRKTGGTNIQEINLCTGGEMVSNKSMKLIAELCPNLQKFNLKSMNVGSKGIEALAKGCRKLRVVTLHDNSKVIGENGLRWLFHGCKDLEIIDLDSNHRLKGPCLHELGNKVKSINLNNCTSLNDVGLEKLHKSCPLITWLNLGDCFILTDIGFSYLSQCSQLTYLNVSGFNANVTSKGLRLLSRLSSLTVLIMSLKDNVNDSVMCDIARGCRKLRCVDISKTPGSLTAFSANAHDITSVSVVELARCCPDLSYLDMNHRTGVTGEGVMALAKCSASLKTLRMRQCNVDTASLTELVTRCHTLEYLGVMECTNVHKSIVNTAIQVLSDQPSSLLELQLGGTKVNKEDVVGHPSNIIIHFGLPSSSRMDDDMDSTLDELYCVRLAPGNSEGECHAGFLGGYYPLFKESEREMI